MVHGTCDLGNCVLFLHPPVSSCPLDTLSKPGPSPPSTDLPCQCQKGERQEYRRQQEGGLQGLQGQRPDGGCVGEHRSFLVRIALHATPSPHLPLFYQAGLEHPHYHLVQSLVPGRELVKCPGDAVTRSWSCQDLNWKYSCISWFKLHTCKEGGRRQ